MEERKQEGNKKRKDLECIWDRFRRSLRLLWCHSGFMTVPSGNFLVIFDVESDVDVHKW